MSCPFCGYDTGGIQVAVCPECGRDPATYRRRVRPWWYCRVIVASLASFAVLNSYGFIGQYGELFMDGGLLYAIWGFYKAMCAIWFAWFGPRETRQLPALVWDIAFWGQPLLLWWPLYLIPFEYSYSL